MESMQTAVLVVVSFAGLYGVQKYLQWRKALNSIENHPGYRTLLSANGIAGNLLDRTAGVTPGRNIAFVRKHDDFAEHGWDIITAMSAFPDVHTMVWVANAAAIKEIVVARNRFPKPVEQYTLLTFFGRNIVASEFHEWKRYRKICAPAFSERNNKLVWDETVAIMTDLFTNVWGGREAIVAEHTLDVTLPIALFVIGVAGFGRRISWNDDLIVPPGHQLTFKDALHIVSTKVFMKLIIPDWALKRGLTEKMARIQLAFDELEKYMLEMIRSRRNSEKKAERYDLFSSLLDASEIEDGDSKLTDSELVGNIFIFLVAGHETTAHTLCFTFALLALYQEEQEKLYQHIKSVIPDGRIPTYDQMNLFTYSMACFNETLRLFPPVVSIPKKAAEDTILVATNPAGEKKTIPVPKGASISLHVPGLHYNPRYWKDPHAFKPERFLEDWPRDAFLPFSAGARACLGRRFFETEGIAILTMLVSQYKIEVKEEPEFAHETFEERKARILTAKPGLTLTPVRVPLVFKRRN